MPVSSSRKDATRVLAIVAAAVFLNIIIETSDVLSPRICGMSKMLPALLCALNSFQLKLKAEKKKKSRHHAPARYCIPIVFGLIFCAGGDYSLRMEEVGTEKDVPYFIIGLVSFLIGHILFIVGFVRDGGNGFQMKWGVVLYGFLGGYLSFLWQYIPADDTVLRIGVVAYCLIIATMCHRSISLSLDAYPTVESTLYATIGSVLFVASDTLLAYNKFVSPIPLQQIWVLGTYFAAIAFISASCAGTDRWSVGWE
jgi:uncharacterized membrane protein YhhN